VKTYTASSESNWEDWVVRSSRGCNNDGDDGGGSNDSGGDDNHEGAGGGEDNSDWDSGGGQLSHGVCGEGANESKSVLHFVGRMKWWFVRLRR